MNPSPQKSQNILQSWSSIINAAKTFDLSIINSWEVKDQEFKDSSTRIIISISAISFLLIAALIIIDYQLQKQKEEIVDILKSNDN